MADQRTMAELLRAPTKGYAEAIVVLPILAEQFKLKHSLINMMTLDQFFGLKKENPHDHINWFNKITSTIKYKDVPNSAIKLMLFPFSLTGEARRWLEKEPPRSILTWEDLVSKFINEFFPPSRTTNLRNEISNFQQRFDELFHEAYDRYKDLLHAYPHHDVLTIIKNKSKVRNSQNKSIISQVKSSDGNSSSSSEIAKLTHKVNQQTSVVTTAMTAILKLFQATPPLAFVKAVDEIYVTCGGAHLYYQCLAADGNTFPEFQDNIQGYVSAAVVNYNQGNSSYRPPGVANQIRPSSFAQPNVQNNQNRFSQPQGYNRGNIFKNSSYQAPIQQNQNMMASFFQMNTASTSGSRPLPSNTITNSKGNLKAITTRSGIVLDGPSVPMPPPFVNSEEDECVEETLTDPELGEYTIMVPPPLVQKAKPPSQRTYVKMLKALLSNKEKLLELANTPLNENCSPVILKKLPEKLEDPGKFLISYGFNDFKCKALADLGASINLMPLLVWKKLGLPELIFTRITLELANRAICTPAGIARDVFFLVGKFTFPADFVIVNYESDPRVLLILGRPFLRTARALIGVHGEDMILCDGDERLTLNMRHDPSSYSNQPQKELINMINTYDDSYEDYLEDLFATNHQSGNLTFSSHLDLTSPEVK
uniref:Reverse transcriptase domain-containing protein n=1 Tax=Tanacetum cinerariifolium TaxID=118510 RepID=A0A699IYD7_TANCI|nr:reverse transcriptase domain-containing protein [Tanacetum cinerariifolium]